MYVPSRFGTGPPTTHAGGDDTGNVPKLQAAPEFTGRRSGTTGTPENAGTRRESHALLHERLRSESRRQVLLLSLSKLKI